MRRRLQPIFVLLVATALLAGCGGADKTKDFNKGFKGVNDQLLALGNEVGQGISSAKGTPDATLASEFTGFAARLRAIKGRLDKLDPPDKLKKRTDDLSRSIDRVVTDLQGIGTAAKEHKPAAARTAAQALVRDSVPLRAARRALARETGAKLGS
jgi:hypothetical protein